MNRLAGVGRGEEAAVRVVQRLREGRDEAADPRLRHRRRRAQLQVVAIEMMHSL